LAADITFNVDFPTHVIVKTSENGVFTKNTVLLLLLFFGTVVGVLVVADFALGDLKVDVAAGLHVLHAIEFHHYRLPIVPEQLGLVSELLPWA